MTKDWKPPFECPKCKKMMILSIDDRCIGCGWKKCVHNEDYS